jgi:hypothetical protein
MSVLLLKALSVLLFKALTTKEINTITIGFQASTFIKTDTITIHKIKMNKIAFISKLV